MSEMSPLELRDLIARHRAGTTTHLELVKLCDHVVEKLPQPVVRGKVCSVCQFPMACRCKNCPNCWADVTLMRQQQMPPPDNSEWEDCRVCTEYIQDSEKFIKLSCGHKYHVSCLIIYHEFKQTRCSCGQNVKIPDLETLRAI